MNENKSRSAFLLLRIGFTAAPIIAGVDKFTNALADWTVYLAPFVPRLLGLAPRTIMMAIGIVEIAAGIIVATKPKIGGWIVSAWLLGIIVDLVIVGGYLDIALRDLGLAIGAAALAVLASGEDDKSAELN